MVGAKRVIWPQKARRQLRDAYEYIKLDSLQNAEKVKKDILASSANWPFLPKSTGQININGIMMGVIGPMKFIDTVLLTTLGQKK